MSDVYTIKYDAPTIAADGRTKSFMVWWKIPDLAVKLKAKHIREFCTSNADWDDDADEDTKFLFKLEVFGQGHRAFKMYYLPPVSMFLKYSLNFSLNWFPCKLIAFATDYSIVQPKWQFVHATSLPNEQHILHFKFEFTIEKKIKVAPFNETKAELNRGLGNMLNNSSYSDVTIKSVEGVEFQSHKVVLAARSDVFKANFEHNTVESVTNVIESPFETEVLQEVLRYIYTENTPKLNEMPEKLLVAADYYQLNILKQLCEEALFEKLTVDNAIATLELAELHSATSLKTNILDFICQGHGRSVLETKGWMEHQPGALTKTILEYIFRNCQINPEQ